jgi:PAS domain S-box-containing protein
LFCRARLGERRLAGRVALIYGLLVTIWILGSDLLLAAASGPPAYAAMRAELVKGMLFVLVSSTVIYLLVAKMFATLDQSERRLRLLAEHVPDMIYRLRLYPDCAFEFVSPAATSLAGYTPAEFYADPDLAYKLVHPDDRDHLVALGRGRILDGLPLELRWVRKDGTVIWTEQRNVPVFDGQGRLVAIEGVVRDIDQRKGAEEQIIWQRRALERAHVALVNSYDVTLSGWSHALDLRDHETEGHSSRVTMMSVHLAQRMGLCGDALEHFRRGALLHDIGKIGIPDAILHKPGPLSEPEWDVMRRHPEHARALLEPIEFLRPALDIPYCHHERWDGTGYPRGLRGETIPLAARIFAVVDVWDALTSDRPYRSAWSNDQVRSYLAASAGHLFDPTVVSTFLAMVEGDRRLTSRKVA